VKLNKASQLDMMAECATSHSELENGIFSMTTYDKLSSYKLYAIPGSLYAGKIRSYLRKQGIPYEECAAGSSYFKETIVEKVGRWIIPVIEAEDGSLLQDGADIIDHFEAAGERRMPTQPEDLVVRAVSYLFEMYGGEGMLRPAMHYRWNFDDDNLAFVKDDFCAGLAPGDDAAMGEQVFNMVSTRMRGVMGTFGVSDESIPTVEKSYKEFLTLFNDHLEGSPYLLGGLPSRGDYGLIAPLYAHLGRDPNPALLMKKVAPRVWRWVERMNSTDHRAPEYLDFNQAYFTADTIPETLKKLMVYVAEDYLPEISAHVAFANKWIADHPGIKEGTLGLKSPGERIIGKAKFEWRGIELETIVMPYRFYMLQRMQAVAASADDAAQAAIRALFAGSGLEAMLDLRTTRPVERKNYAEIWGAPIR